MKKVELFIFVTLNIVLSSPMANAGGDSVGNGGVIWACRSGNGGRNFHRGLLTDLFEAREQYKWNLVTGSGSDPMKIYQDRKDWLARELPEVFQALGPRFEYVETHQTFVNAELLSTRDFNNALKPLASACEGGEWQPLNIANFREEDQQLLISAELWGSDRISSLDKAALLFHEAIYYWMRTYFGSTDSDKSRKITGVLFSTLPTAKIKEVITQVLGSYPDRPDVRFICVMKNSQRNQVYVSYAEQMNEASLMVRMRCQADPDSNWCERSSIECQEIVSGPRHQCVSEHSGTRKIYSGQGRNLLEAQFNAHMACYVGSVAQGASAQQCPDFTFMECD